MAPAYTVRAIILRRHNSRRDQGDFEFYHGIRRLRDVTAAASAGMAAARGAV